MKYPVTPAIRFLKKQGIPFERHLYAYRERGGTKVSARQLNVPESSVVKTLIFKDQTGKPLIVLMTGDKQVSTKALARRLGVKQVVPCDPGEAEKHSGYKVGGTSPFGVRKNMPVYLEKCVLDLNTLYINGGKRGFLVSLTPNDLIKLLNPTVVEVGISHA
ncbi:MAG: Cys-tRNA(Pro) deacylase [Acidobacteria bacterium]|nr:MAG: Cys-tRNA(Pro) deacylase [Acidobacteriota bacterium]PIE91602.1 MAG: Cys-tRNA(Pro) deacylase [Acidobacteriota bacterium]